MTPQSVDGLTETKAGRHQCLLEKQPAVRMQLQVDLADSFPQAQLVVYLQQRSVARHEAHDQ